jgi:ATP-dependent helicase/nuclease subunit A
MGWLMEANLNPLAERVLETFGLAPEQYRAASIRGQNIIVTAGAGSGKTRTLVARYISLLAEGFSPRRVVAITFTEKAAREMRSRVRSALVDQITRIDALTAELNELQRWNDLDAQMDSARIGTIHSLCAEILRTHPAEARIDPRFDVLDEGLAATLRVQAVTDTLTWLIEKQEFLPLLTWMTTAALENLLLFLLDHRLEAQTAFEEAENTHQILLGVIQTSITHSSLVEPLKTLRSLHTQNRLRADASDLLAEQIESLLRLWSQAEQALIDGDVITAANHLFSARRNYMGGNTGKKTSVAKARLAELKNAYDARLDPWLGGKKPADIPPDASIEQAFTQAQLLIHKAFDHLLELYQGALNQRQAVDFDDLEAGAVRLLEQRDIRQHWQAEVDALLVDEFQDTNARQRKIVQALCGDEPGRLFVVGDARQSIYRFRRADVVVFRQMQQEIQKNKGVVIDLDITYRAHAPLLQTAGDLLAGVMGEEPDLERPFYVPFTALFSNHENPRQDILSPHVEFILGAGDDAAAARPIAARALAKRLLELHQAGQIQRWDDVALLFRASTGFPVYETAFEETGIPFVTVAGQGFYNRPEIRDVLNLLRALADPWDDLAMAGLLRSPAFGLSDAALYRLRWQGLSSQEKVTVEQKRPYWITLQGDLGCLDENEQGYAQRAVDLLNELQPLVDRLPVAELIKRLVDRVDYRAILASSSLEGGRLWRNLDKLLDDAQASGLVNVRAFLDYLDTLRDVGAREGEAPAEALGAVRLMTIHKSKGLEFPVVVLADAARRRRNTSDIAYLLPETGLAFKMDQLEAAPLLYRLAKWLDGLQEDAEEKRLLYVALTRAQEKLLISGHCTMNKSGEWKTEGWLGELIKHGNIQLNSLVESGQPCECETCNGHPLRAWAMSAQNEIERAAIPAEQGESPESTGKALYRPLPAYIREITDPEPEEVMRNWRATGERLRPPAEALGHLVHRAIQNWLFPIADGFMGQSRTYGDSQSTDALNRLLETAALEAGLADAAQRSEALRLAEILLIRFRQDPLWLEIDRAELRYHEIPYSYLTPGNRLDTGFIDLLYRSKKEDAQSWQVLDFKTDSLRNKEERLAAIEHYRPQMQRYALAVGNLLREPVRVRICFLDDEGKVSLATIKFDNLPTFQYNP